MISIDGPYGDLPEKKPTEINTKGTEQISCDLLADRSSVGERRPWYGRVAGARSTRSLFLSGVTFLYQYY